nr:hypothetical protein BHI3_25550 [Bacteriovorax sp. HI3]
MKKSNTVLLFSLLLLGTGCAQFSESERIPASGTTNIISTPKSIGFIFLGKTKTLREEISSAKYVLSEDMERDRLIQKDWTPIGDFIVRPGTVLKLTKDTYMYTKAADIIRGVDKNSALFLKEGTKVRILQYNQSSLTATTAIIEVID